MTFVLWDKDKRRIMTRRDLLSLGALEGSFTNGELRGYLTFICEKEAETFIDKRLKSSHRFETKNLR